MQICIKFWKATLKVLKYYIKDATDSFSLGKKIPIFYRFWKAKEMVHLMHIWISL